MATVVWGIPQPDVRQHSADAPRQGLGRTCLTGGGSTQRPQLDGSERTAHHGLSRDTAAAALGRGRGCRSLVADHGPRRGCARGDRHRVVPGRVSRSTSTTVAVLTLSVSGRPPVQTPFARSRPAARARVRRSQVASDGRHLGHGHGARVVGRVAEGGTASRPRPASRLSG